MFIIKKKPYTNLDRFNNSCLVKGRINGSVVVPGDKSISHRALIIGLLSIGITKIKMTDWSFWGTNQSLILIDNEE